MSMIDLCQEYAMGGTLNQEGIQCWHRGNGSPFIVDEADESLAFLLLAHQDNSPVLHVTLV